MHVTRGEGLLSLSPCAMNPISAAKVIPRELSQGLSLGRPSGFYGLRLQF